MACAVQTDDFAGWPEASAVQTDCFAIERDKLAGRCDSSAVQSDCTAGQKEGKND